MGGSRKHQDLSEPLEITRLRKGEAAASSFPSWDGSANPDQGQRGNQRVPGSGLEAEGFPAQDAQACLFFDLKRALGGEMDARPLQQRFCDVVDHARQIPAVEKQPDLRVPGKLRGHGQGKGDQVNPGLR